jgi:exodeoxyribonuclease III
LQELKAQRPDLSAEMLAPDGMHARYHCAEKKGYSGVGVWSRQAPLAVVEGFDAGEFDAEGRYIRADFGNLSVISLYLPSGSSSPERQDAKFRFLDIFCRRCRPCGPRVGRSCCVATGILPIARSI